MIKRIILLIILLTGISTVSFSQVIKGKITNQSGDPIAYATVYIQELKQGTTSNTKGDYEIKLPAGKYLVNYQSLGYQPVFIDITLSTNTIIKDVKLPLQYYEIPEVRITASGEDPAYIIMRKVIGMAPYYLNNISYYKANVYLKGNLIVNKIPKLIQRQMKVEARNEHGTVASSNTIKEGDVYLMESYNEMEFTAPDKYFQKVISIKSNFPDQGDDISPMDFIEASFYQPVIADMAISPLSPAAFSHYNFRYLGSTTQGNNTINKIQVIPKRKSQQVFEGTIYIIEDLWCIHSVDLANENLVGKIKVQQLYVPVQDDIWMPVSHKFEINISIIGFKAEAGYGSSVKYNEVRPNKSLQRPATIATNYTGKPAARVAQDTTVSKSKKQIEKILEKDELNNRDMAKLARLMDKETKQSIPDSSRKKLEIVDNTTQVVEKDAAKKDSAFWAEVRPIPLSEIEVKSLRVSDSIKNSAGLKTMKSDSSSTDTVKVNKKKNKVIGNLLTGHTWSDTTGFSFTHGGFIDLKNIYFNTVDGFTYGLSFRISKRWKDGSVLSFFPDFKWAFSREQFMWRISSTYRFSGSKPSQLYLRAGQLSKDIGTGGGINTLLNTATSLLFENNYMKLYDSKYLNGGYRTEIVNGLNLELGAAIEKRTVLENTTDFTFVNTSKSYSDNTPDNSYIDEGADPRYPLADNQHAELTARISYTPFQRYMIRNNNKIPRGSDWPTFTLTWQHGMNRMNENNNGNDIRVFDQLRFDASKRHEAGAFAEFRWRVRAGGFIDKTNLTFFDFSHFNPQPPLLLLDNYQDAFMLPAYYSLSTPEMYGEVHLKYTTPYLLLKLLPVLSNTLMRENLSLSFLGTKDNPAYTELGYSISEVFFLGEAGVYAGFDNFNFKSIGAKIILRFN